MQNMVNYIIYRHECKSIFGLMENEISHKSLPSVMTLRGRRNYSTRAKTICNMKYNKLYLKFTLSEKRTQ